MNTKQLLASSALALIVATTVAVPAQAGGKEKCYGVASAGQNDCANLSGTHSCSGQSTVDNELDEWKLVAKGTCEDMGGLLKAAAKARFEADHKG